MLPRFLLSWAIAFLLITVMAFSIPASTLFQKQLPGAWSTRSADTVQLAIFTDGYFSHTAYTENGRRFLFSRGGPFQAAQNNIQVRWEYDTRQPQNVGTVATMSFEQKEAGMLLKFASEPAQMGAATWKQLDDGTGPLAGAWRITRRMQEGKLQTIHQTGTRKTVKLLTGTCFQWVAIDPGVKGFYGTGGGTYTFKDGKYTERIAFFSRDSSRVGASLQFNGKVENGDWHHSGKSSRGEDIYEVWSRK